MRKKIVTIAVCLALGAAMFGCKATTPSGSGIPTPSKENTEPIEEATTAPTATTAPEEEMPITDYEACVATTKLPENYMGIEVEAVTEDELTAYLDTVLEANLQKKSVEREIKEGDTANIDFTGYIDGETFEGGSSVGYELVIGSGSFITGFEEGLIGAKKGETRSLELNFPDPYLNNPDLAGKPVVFEVKINAVSEYVKPELTDDFVASLTSDEYKTVDEFTEFSKGVLLEEKQYLAVTDFLIENTSYGEINEEYVQASVDSMKSYYEMYASIYGMSLEDFLVTAGVENPETFWTDMEEDMRRAEKERVALYCVAKEEEITLTEEEFTTYATEIAAGYDCTLEEFMQDYDRAYVEQTILMERALELLVESTVVK